MVGINESVFQRSRVSVLKKCGWKERKECSNPYQVMGLDTMAGTNSHNATSNQASDISFCA